MNVDEQGGAARLQETECGRVASPIADTLAAVRQVHPDLPRYLIAGGEQERDAPHGRNFVAGHLAGGVRQQRHHADVRGVVQHDAWEPAVQTLEGKETRGAVQQVVDSLLTVAGRVAEEEVSPDRLAGR